MRRSAGDGPLAEASEEQRPASSASRRRKLAEDGNQGPKRLLGEEPNLKGADLSVPEEAWRGPEVVGIAGPRTVQPTPEGAELPSADRPIQDPDAVWSG